MKRIFLIHLAVVLIFLCSPARAYKIFPSTHGCFDCGGGSITASGYVSWASIGQSAVEQTANSEYKNYSGFILVMITLSSSYALEFLDPSPTSTSLQETTHVTCKVTVDVKGGNAVDLNTIKYRISSSGTDNFNEWRVNASTVSINVDTTTVRFQILIPNVYADSFGESENNYIQWQCRDTVGNQKNSEYFRIKVRVNDIPVITIIQPDDGEYASIQPIIEAEVKDEQWGVDPDSVQLELESYPEGVKIFSLNSVSNPEIYDPQTRFISYWYQAGENTLADGERYRASISVQDLSVPTPKQASAQTIFIVRAGTIVDVIPYPSPFDPEDGTTIRYVLGKASKVTIKIYNMAGSLVKTVIQEIEKSAGEHTEDKWFGDNYAREELANGIYFCEIIVENDEGVDRRYQSLAIFGK